MRRWILAVVVAVSLLTAVPATAAEDDPALVAAREAFAGDPTRDTTLVLRDLFMSLQQLDGSQRREAQAYLARPTDGSTDQFGDGYSVPAQRKCRANICIHWVPTTADAPPSQAWVNSTLKFMNKVWRFEVGELGYRPPLGDARRGGNAKLDVYLKEVGARGVYGYCAPERRAKGRKWLASGYCVLDNDFAEAQYGAPPRESMRVTAAHEFFHAVQYSYDYGEDPWLMESTATWMEERVADDVNDNRQYLAHGQVGQPAQSLDRFNEQGFNQYGNWAFFEFLASRYGTRVVRSIWNEAGAFAGAGYQFSTAAVKSVLARHGGFVKVFRAYAGGNSVPARTYGEGKAWPAAPVSRTWELTKAQRRSTDTLRINHMASRNVKIRPGTGIRKGWKLRITVDGPPGRTSPAAYLVVRRKHGIGANPIRLNGKGVGRATIAFSPRSVSSATVSLVNASTRFSCWHRTNWSCQGRARDDQQRFTLTATAVPPRRR